MKCASVLLFGFCLCTSTSLHPHIYSLPIYAAIYPSVVMQVCIFPLCFPHLVQEMHLFRGPPRTSETRTWTTEMQNLLEKIHCKCEVQCMLVLFQGEQTCSLFPRSCLLLVTICFLLLSPQPISTSSPHKEKCSSCIWQRIIQMSFCLAFFGLCCLVSFGMQCSLSCWLRWKRVHGALLITAMTISLIGVGSFGTMQTSPRQLMLPTIVTPTSGSYPILPSFPPMTEWQFSDDIFVNYLHFALVCKPPYRRNQPLLRLQWITKMRAIKRLQAMHVLVLMLLIIVEDVELNASPTGSSSHLHTDIDCTNKSADLAQTPPSDIESWWAVLQGLS